MGLFAKVLSLIIAQIIVIIACLYVHLDDFEYEKSQTVENKEATQSLLDKAKAFLSNNDSINENNTSITSEEQTSNQPVTTVNRVEQKIKPKVKEIKKEAVQKPKPLITTKTIKPIEQKESEVKKSLTKKVVKEVEAVKPIKKEIKKAQITDAKVKKLFEKKKSEASASQPAVLKQITPKVLSSDDKAIEKEISAIVSKNGIIFKRLSTDVTEKSMTTIEQVAQVLKNYPDVKIEVGGHTDAKGDEEVNAYISKHRALSVKKILVEFGIDANRLSAKGYGESKPIVKNDPRGYSILNRRVEFKIIKE